MTTVRIADLSEFVLDGTHGSPVRTENGVPVLSAQNVKHGVLNYETDRFTTEQEFNAFNARLGLKEGDFLLTIVGTIGRSAVVSEVRPLVFQRSVAIIRPKKAILDSRFLFHASQTQRFQSQLVASANTSSQAGIYLGKLKEVTIPLPLLTEQRRIAEVLDRAEALRAKRRASLVQLDALTQSLFVDAFGDPITNPKCIRTAKLGSLCVRVTDGTHQPPKWSDAGHPFLFVSNIVSGEITFETEKFISDETHTQLTKRCPIELGDVLYSTVGSYGVPAIVRSPRKFAFQRHIAHLKPDYTLLNSAFLAAMLASPPLKRQADRAAKGVAQKTVNLSEIREFIVFQPPLSQQSEFARRVAAVERLKASQRAALAALDALFASLQHRAFRGEL